MLISAPHPVKKATTSRYMAKLKRNATSRYTGMDSPCICWIWMSLLSFSITVRYSCVGSWRESATGMKNPAKTSTMREMDADLTTSGMEATRFWSLSALHIWGGVAARSRWCRGKKRAAYAVCTRSISPSRPSSLSTCRLKSDMFFGSGTLARDRPLGRW